MIKTTLNVSHLGFGFICLDIPVPKQGCSSSVRYSNKFRRYERQKAYGGFQLSTIRFGEFQDFTVIDLFFKSENKVLGLRRKVVEHL
jgi:hypothetical protein